MANVLFGAFYENNILYIDAFDVDNCIDLNIRVQTVAPINNQNPTPTEKVNFRNQINQAIQNLAIQFQTASLYYQGPSRTINNIPGNRTPRGIKKMTAWAEFVLDEIQLACTANSVQFNQRVKTSKPTKGTVRKKGITRQVGPNFLQALTWVLSRFVNHQLSGPQKHCFASALGLGNSKKSYETWVRRMETHRYRARGQKITKENKALIEQIVAQIPF